MRTTGASSVLDYIISGKKISSTFEDILIDEQCLFCPFSIKKTKNNTHQQFSDHNPIIFDLKIPHEKKKEVCLPVSWHLTKDGLEKFNQLTSSGFDMNLQGNNIQEKYNSLENKIKKIMNECFKVNKKRKISRRPIQREYFTMYRELTKFARGGKSQRRVAKLYIEQIIKANTDRVAEMQKKKILATVNNLTVNNTFSPNKFWNLCKKRKKSDPIVPLITK